MSLLTTEYKRPSVASILAASPEEYAILAHYASELRTAINEARELLFQHWDKFPNAEIAVMAPVSDVTAVAKLSNDDHKRVMDCLWPLIRVTSGYEEEVRAVKQLMANYNILPCYVTTG